MDNIENTLKTQVEQSFAKILNRNGYGFQFSVLKKLHELGKQAQSAFTFETIEFPVEVQGSGTRIDFILSKRSRNTRPFYILAECKRANPSLSNWCFLKSPYVHKKRWNDIEPMYIEYIEFQGNQVSAFAKSRSQIRNFYHIGLEVKSNTKGDKDGETGQAIENASSQVSRGLNGFIETLTKNQQILGNEKSADIMPVIFTTANLWESEVDLSIAELETGNSDLTNIGFKNIPWLCYQYHLSPGIKHTKSPKDKPDQISDLMDTEFIRTIPIVSAGGIQDFIRWASFSLDLDNY